MTQERKRKARPPLKHPLKKWGDAQGLTCEDIAERCREKGRPTVSAAYLRQVLSGHRRPGYDFAKFLSAEITGGAVAVVELMEFRRAEAAA